MNIKIKSIFVLLFVLNVLVLGAVLFLWVKSDLQLQASKKIIKNQNLKLFTASELSKFNGVDPKLPIYLALDGYVYDITSGVEFYKVGGPYHDLAGKDASQELYLVGGDIIRRKYSIVG